jgi:signal transduction histidine kinase
MVPIKVGATLRGMVVVPPRCPFGGALWDAGRLLSIPDYAVAIAIGIAAGFIVDRRAGSAIWKLPRRLGAGDCRHGHQRPRRRGARLARSFNRMAVELATRDEALRTSDRSAARCWRRLHEWKTPLISMRGYLETIRFRQVS